MSEPRKRIFIGLIVFTVFLITAITVGLYLIPYVGLKNIHPLAPKIVCVSMGTVVGTLVFGVALLVLTLIRGREIFGAQRLRGVVIEVLFPIMIVVGKFLGISKEKIQRSFVEVNNLLVLAKCSRKRPERVLLLMPHCLQNNDCEIKITSDASKCKACGKCRIKDLVELAQKHKVHLSVATGGTLARRRVAEAKPQAIIAVACERDLTSGIQDAYPLPVIGILNDRPFGPCFNTSVDIAKVAEALEYFANGQCGSPGTGR
ncbi:MAG: hypothetical protein A2X56_07115 [Nitrospirae bacterium GWC2_57_13]|nr:MAG: hypothetical protein A2X56_07115 [Nitrospirae bacterium GWC2_57_13]